MGFIDEFIRNYDLNDECVKLFLEACSKVKLNLSNNKVFRFTELEHEIYYSAKYANYLFKLKKIIVYFKDFIRGKEFEIATSSYDNKLSYDKNIELLKYIQEEKSTSEIMNHLGITSDRNLRSAISAYEGGVDIYGNLVVLKNRIDGRQRRSSVNSNELYIDSGASANPIGLVLNHVELYSLCEILNDLDSDSIHYNIYKSILDKIYTQLSIPAKKMCDEKTEGKLKNADLKYVAPQNMNKVNSDIRWAIAYHLKSRSPIEICFMNKGELLIKQGSIDITKNPYILNTLDGEVFEIKKEDIKLTGFIKKIKK